MAPDPTDRHPDGRPVLSGLAALVVAALGIVAVAGAAIFVLDRAGGGDSAQDGEAGRGAGQELVIPSVSPKAADDEPVAPPFTDDPRPTLGPVDPDDGTGEVPAPTDFTLTAGSSQVDLGGQLDLTGTFPGTEGTVLQVERLTNGTWEPFPVDATVQPGGTYSTYITSSVGGDASFRMTDPATQQSSNEVEVTIG